MQRVPVMLSYMLPPIGKHIQTLARKQQQIAVSHKAQSV